MNLQEILNYRTKCPICNSNLSIVFHSNKRQTVKYEYDRLLVVFPMDAITNKKKSYQVGYSFNLQDNSFFIEFYNKTGELLRDRVPVSVLDRFKEMNKNLVAYSLYKSCKNPLCTRYHYSTNYFTIELDNCNVGELSIAKEYFCLLQPMDDGYKIYKLVNYCEPKKTSLNYGKITNEEYEEFYSKQFLDVRIKHVITTHLINVTSQEETVERLNKLLVFS